MYNESTIKKVLSDTLGSYNDISVNELAFFCPFCHHHKRKLQINVKNQKWHCWVCNSGGKKLTYLLKRLNVDKSVLLKVKEFYGDIRVGVEDKDDSNADIQLPKEYISLAVTSTGFNPEHKHAINYLKSRGIGIKEIVKYKIGYCIEGIYARRIIIPSYSDNGKLNYFVSRSYYNDEKIKYKNPPISKNIICFDSQINWSEPIILCEGVFDAISIKRNAIPLLGKFPSKSLVGKIFLNGVKQITISLDSDATTEAVKSAEYFRKNGINVKMMYLKDKDAAEMGYTKFYNEFQKSKEFNSEDFLLLKISQL
jgi:DNA primase